MPEGTVAVNGFSLWYETFGNRTDSALVLVNGLATQGIGWPTALCQRLAAGSHYVIRFDHRDVGFSSEFGDDATYTYEDMSDDVVGLLDAPSASPQRTSSGSRWAARSPSSWRCDIRPTC